MNILNRTICDGKEYLFTVLGVFERRHPSTDGWTVCTSLCKNPFPLYQRAFSGALKRGYYDEMGEYSNG